MNKIIYILSIITLGLLSSCEKEKTDEQNKIYDSDFTKGVLIGCEGGFNKGDAEIGFYNSFNTTWQQGLFNAKNNYPLGDVLQSISEIKGKYYLVVNNSGKIEIIDKYTLFHTGQIKGLPSPRYLYEIPGTNKAYCSNFFTNELSIIDLNLNKVSSKLNIGYFTENIEFVNDRAYACCLKSDKVYIIDTKNDLVLDSIPVGDEPQWIVKDKNNQLWVLCNNYLRKKPCQLMQIDPIQNKVTKVIDFKDIKQSPSKLTLNANKDSLYWLDRGVFKMSINDGDIPRGPFFERRGIFFYGLGVDPKKDNIFISDPSNFSSRGTVYIINNSGNVLDSSLAGVAPSSFLFVRP